MEYLANPFNYLINQPSNYGIYALLNITYIYLFYYILFAICKKLEEIPYYETLPDCNFEIKNIPDKVFDNVFNDISIDDKVKIHLSSLLETNSLDRVYILYYIFKKHGTFDDDYGNKDINTFAYYKTVLNDWLKNCFNTDYNNLIINLDERLEKNYQIVIGNVICNCNIAHVRFLSWLYYSGIYQYLENRVLIKNMVLNEMNNKKLLNGNLFLKYQLYLIDMENKNIDCINEKIKIEDNEKTDVDEDISVNETNENKDELNNDVDFESNEDNSSDNSSYNSATNSDDNSDDNSNDNSENDDINDSISYSFNNDDELLSRDISDELDEINETIFISKLFTSVKNISIRSFITTWQIIKEETTELFHPVLG